MVVQLNAWGVGYVEAKALIDELFKLREENKKMLKMLERVKEHGCLKRNAPPCGNYPNQQHCTVCRDLKEILENNNEQ
jgi:hypothetical protein